MNLIYLSFMIQCTYADVNYLGSIKDKPLQYYLQKEKDVITYGIYQYI